MESKVKYLNFAITQSVVNISSEISHADRGTIHVHMKHFKLDLRSKAPGGLRGRGRSQNGQNVKIQLFSELGHVAYQIKWNHECSNMVSTILPADPSPGHIAYQIKGKEVSTLT